MRWDIFKRKTLVKIINNGITYNLTSNKSDRLKSHFGVQWVDIYNNNIEKLSSTSLTGQI